MSALLVSGRNVTGPHIPRTIPFACSADSGADVGMNQGTPVSKLYGDSNNAFTGVIRKVVVEVKKRGGRMAA